MKKKSLYLGLDPTRYQSENELVHLPLIETNLIQGGMLKKALSQWDSFSHVLFTSKRSVFYLRSLVPLDPKKSYLAIGKETAKATGKKVQVAKEATQEGVIELLQTLNLNNIKLLFPHAKRARPLIVEFLKKENVQFFDFCLYDTTLKKEKKLPKLEEFSEIVFTSPSTVDAFLQNYRCFPENTELKTIGKITENYLLTCKKECDIIDLQKEIFYG